MRTAIILAVCLAASPALAQRGLGVGAEGTIGSGAVTGGGGPTVAYDLESIFIEGGLAFVAGDGADAVTLGAACYYKVATTEASDFSLGGGAALLFRDPDGGPFGGGDADLGVAITLGAKIRAFLVSNVAFQAGLGLNILIDDGGEVFLFNSQLAGSAGMIYFF